MQKVTKVTYLSRRSAIPPHFRRKLFINRPPVIANKHDTRRRRPPSLQCYIQYALCPKPLMSAAYDIGDICWEKKMQGHFVFFWRRWTYV